MLSFNQLTKDPSGTLLKPALRHCPVTALSSYSSGHLWVVDESVAWVSALVSPRGKWVLDLDNVEDFTDPLDPQLRTSIFSFRVLFARYRGLLGLGSPWSGLKI